jgi:hypothetical protein
MLEYHGVLKKMLVRDTLPVKYALALGNTQVEMSPLLNKTIKIDYHHSINCLHCGQKTKKSFAQGYCYPCYISIPETDPSVINPELNQAHLGISRNMEWSLVHDLIDHYVYIAVTSNIKVGVTRHTQIPTRWIDQGAQYAIIIAKTPYRQLAGEIEVALKTYFNDKTNWRKMLQEPILIAPNLSDYKLKVWQMLPATFEPYYFSDDTITQIQYPVIKYPKKITSLNLDNQTTYTGVLCGIKGQYLMFTDGTVLNIRKFGGYNVSLSIL